VGILSFRSVVILFYQTYPDKADRLFELEDHDLLQGQMSIVGLERPDNFLRFQSLFSCEPDLTDCALMSIGYYGQKEKNGWRYQLGSKKKNSMAWRNLFHKSGNEGFERTKSVLAELLSRADSFTDEMLSGIINNYINDCESNNTYELRYYYAKYDLFRPGSYGKYWWRDPEKPYEFSVMKTETKISENTYQPFLKAVFKEKLSKDHNGQRAIDGDNYIVCLNSAYVVRNIVTNMEVERIPIAQDENGIDTEDRIKKLESLIRARG